MDFIGREPPVVGCWKLQRGSHAAARKVSVRKQSCLEYPSMVHIHPFHACEHGEVNRDEDATETLWVDEDSHSAEVLRRTLNDPTLARDMGYLTEFCHTGALEVFHSNMLRSVLQHMVSWHV